MSVLERFVAEVMCCDVGVSGDLYNGHRSQLQVKSFGTGAFHGWPFGGGGGSLRGPKSLEKKEEKSSG